MVDVGVPSAAIAATIQEMGRQFTTEDLGCLQKGGLEGAALEAARKSWQPPNAAQSRQQPDDPCEAVVRMVRVRVPEGAIVATISEQNISYTGPEVECIERKVVSEAVIAAVRSKQETKEEADLRQQFEEAEKRQQHVARMLQQFEGRGPELRAIQHQHLVDSANARNFSPWVLTVEQDPMYDSAIVIATIDAIHPWSGWTQRAVRPALVARCRRGELNLIVRTGLQANPELGNYGGATVRVRFDEEEPLVLNTGESTTGESLFLPNSESLLEALAESDTLKFEFTPFRSSPVLAVFQTSGFTAAEELLQEACQPQPWLPPNASSVSP